MPGQDTSPQAHPGTVDTDAVCLVCGYNLRSLRNDARCPECGTDVFTSLHGGLLRNCDPSWIATLQCGISLLLITQVAQTLVAAMAAGAVMGNAFAERARQLLAYWTELPYVLGLIGCWMLCSPPGKAHPETFKLPYAGAALHLAWWAVVSRVLVCLNTAGGRPSTFLGGAHCVLFLVFSCLLTLHLCTIAAHVPDRRLVGRMRFLMLGGLVMWVTAAIASLWEVPALAGWSERVNYAVWMCGMVAFGVAWIQALVTLRRKLTRSMAASLQQWTAASAPAPAITAATGTAAPAPGEPQG